MKRVSRPRAPTDPVSVFTEGLGIHVQQYLVALRARATQGGPRGAVGGGINPGRPARARSATSASASALLWAASLEDVSAETLFGPLSR